MPALTASALSLSRAPPMLRSLAHPSSTHLSSPLLLSRGGPSSRSLPISPLAPLSHSRRAYNAQAGPSRVSNSTTSTSTIAPPSATRAFSFTSHRYDASTALRPEVKKREEKSGEEVVGRSGKGVEGPHFQDQLPMNISLKDDAKGWTLFKPIYSQGEMEAVQVVGRTPVTISDKLAHGFVKFLRGSFDFVSGYTPHHVPESVTSQQPIPVEQLRKDGKILSDKQWLLRIIVLESFAGVPGMVGGTLRHLRSLRLLRRDGGWIHTLLEEAENERMHLLTFLTISQPTWITRALVLATQGVMYNLFFATYLISPKTAHRFVGALEEEAVRTYTHCISDIERGLIPEWNDKPAPQIAIDYWRLPTSATLLDVVRAVRADEATHRFVNHSLADLDQKKDFNPFAIGEPSADIRGTKYGFTREESAEFAKQSQEKLMQQARQIGDQ